MTYQFRDALPNARKLFDKECRRQLHEIKMREILYRLDMVELEKQCKLILPNIVSNISLTSTTFCVVCFAKIRRWSK